MSESDSLGAGNMRSATLPIVAALSVTACDVVSGLDDFGVRPGASGAGASGAATTTSAAGGKGGGGGTGATGGGTPAECPLDRFDDGVLDTTLWNVEQSRYAYFLEQASQLYLEVSRTKLPNRFATLTSVDPYPLASCPLALEIFPGSVGDEVDEYFYFTAILDDQNSCGFALSNGILTAGALDGGTFSTVDQAYAASEMRWWRTSAVSSNLRFEVSPDGQSWTIFHETTVHFALDAVHAVIAGGAGTALLAEGGAVTMDNFNAPP